MPPLGDVVERQRHRGLRQVEAVAEAAAPEIVEELRLRKFRRAFDAAIDRVDDLGEALSEIGERRVAGHGALAAIGLRRQPRAQRIGIVAHLGLLVAIDARHLAQHIDEARPAVARLVGEIGAAPERLGVGGEEHGQRPAAMLAKLVQRRHVDGVDVGTLLAVDLDVDEEVVHHLRGGVVLEALMGHDMAPMAGGIADREQDRLPRALGLGERLRPPGPPMHRVVLVLEEIGARLAAKAILARRRIRLGICHRASNRV